VSGGSPLLALYDATAERGSRLGLSCAESKNSQSSCLKTAWAKKGRDSMKDLFEQYRNGKGTLVISFNDATTITGDFVKQSDGFLEISGQANAIDQICYVPYPNDNIKYMYWRDPDAPTHSPL
jgi:hypothetical protein